MLQNSSQVRCPFKFYFLLECTTCNYVPASTEVRFKIFDKQPFSIVPAAGMTNYLSGFTPSKRRRLLFDGRTVIVLGVSLADRLRLFLTFIRRE